jgi:hypothetical protein
MSLKRLKKKNSTKTMTLDLNDTEICCAGLRLDPYLSYYIEFSLVGRANSKIQ